MTARPAPYNEFPESPLPKMSHDELLVYELELYCTGTHGDVSALFIAARELHRYLPLFAKKLAHIAGHIYKIEKPEIHDDVSFAYKSKERRRYGKQATFN